MCSEQLQHAGLVFTGESGQLPNASPLLALIASWLESVGGWWEGTASELVNQLAITAPRVGLPRAVPRTAARLGQALRALQDDFEKGGVEIEFRRNRRSRAITLTHVVSGPSQDLTDLPRPADEPGGLQFLSQRQLAEVLAEIEREQTRRRVEGETTRLSRDRPWAHPTHRW